MRTAARTALLAFHGVVLASAVVVIHLTRTDPDLLDRLTRETGPYERLTAVAAAAAGLYALAFLLTVGSKLSRLERTVLVLVSIGCIFIAGEEVSWGQRAIGFETPEFLRGPNLQDEANLHNLVISNVLSTIVFVVIYAFFVFAPALHSFEGVRKGCPPAPSLVRMRPDLHGMLIFAGSGTLHAFFTPISMGDTLACFASIALLSVVVFREPARRKDPAILAHLALVVLAALVLAIHHELLPLDNAQYEIRELMLCYGTLYWLLIWRSRIS
jgi:hypothetical protein